MPSTHAPAFHDVAPVLVVDDNAVNRMAATHVIQGIGYRVVEAADARTALRLIIQMPISLVFMDIQMPDMDGIEATYHIRAAERGTDRHLIILGLTVHDQPADRAAGLQAGMDDYIAKPATVNVLRMALAQWLPQATTTASPRLCPLGGPPPTSGQQP